MITSFCMSVSILPLLSYTKESTVNTVLYFPFNKTYYDYSISHIKIAPVPVKNIDSTVWMHPSLLTNPLFIVHKLLFKGHAVYHYDVMGRSNRNCTFDFQNL